jgi:2-polyprenyl-3-methyl-5-hydroxy-6-metoxy-1,4-benzoquinol methylase
VQRLSLAEASRPCPVCESTQAEAYLNKSTLRLVRCRTCSMIYANPVPSEYASGQYYDTTGADYYLTPAKLESDYADVRFARELRLFGKHCAGGAVLDVGCSSGGFLYQLRRRFPGTYEILGIDASGPALDYAASRGVPVLRGNFLEQDFGACRFDAVTFWAVLEHLFDPKRFLEKAWTILKPEGVCYILVPNKKSLAFRLLGARYRYIYPQHLNYFTRATLTRLVQSRFSIVEFRSTHFNPVVIWQDWRTGGREISNQERAELLQRTTAYKQNPLLKPAKLFYGLSEKCLAALNLADNLAVVLFNKS